MKQQQLPCHLLSCFADACLQVQLQVRAMLIALELLGVTTLSNGAGGPADAARMLACMNSIFDAVRTGATFTLPRDTPDGAGATLGACLEQLVAEWKIL